MAEPMSLPWLDSATINFPDIDFAFAEPNGLLAAGGDLSTERLLAAYRKGIFPWYEDGQPILWWSPDLRMVIVPDELRISKSLNKALKNSLYEVSMDAAFSEVISCCAEARPGCIGTWITEEMQLAYTDLHHAGYAHSVEVWREGDLVGGLYGVALGQVFFGESMFSFASNTSKIALVHLVKQLQQWNYELIDCQVSSQHLKSLGATEISRNEFKKRLQKLLPAKTKTGYWELQYSFTESV